MHAEECLDLTSPPGDVSLTHPSPLHYKSHPFWFSASPTTKHKHSPTQAMAKLSSSPSLCLCVWFLALGSCLAFRRNQCQWERLEALKPDNVIKSEAGRIETWNPNHEQLRCAGLALARCTLEKHALRIPSYSNSPQLIFIKKGIGYFGVVLPGCANTYEEAQESESGHRWRSRDRHQKIRRFRAGDVLTVPAGISFWMYNSGNENVEAIHLLHTGSDQNLLDGTPRRFYLGGKQQQEFLQYQQGRQQQQQPPRSRREGQQGQEQEQEQEHEEGQGQQQEQQQGGNVISGFERDFVTRALNVDNDTAGHLQGENLHTVGGIIRVKEGLHFFAPPPRRQRPQEQQEEEEDVDDEEEPHQREEGDRRRPQHQQQQEEQERDRRGREGEEERGRRSQHQQQQQQQQQPEIRGREGERRSSENGLEETYCSLRLQQNIGKSTSPDIYHPLAGSLRTLNSFDLPVLRQMELSVEFGSLHNNALYVPHYNLNANSIIYALDGRAQIQVVDCSGNSVFNEELREGQALTVPQNYAVAIKSRSEHFLWVAFKTNAQAMISTLAEQIQAWPEEVVAQVFQLRGQQAAHLKNRSPLHFLVPPPESHRAVA